MVRPDHGADARLAEHVGRRAVVLGRHDHERRAAAPFARELQDLVRARQLAVDQDRIGAGLRIRVRAAQRLVHAPAGDQRLDARDDREIRIALRILAGLDLAAELVDLGERLALAVDEAVGFRKLLVLDAHAGDAALLELSHEPAHVVEVAVAGVAVEQDRQVARVGHEFEHVDHLCPARLVVVAHAELRGDREPRRPDALEARLADDARGQAVVRLHQEFERRARQHPPQPRAARFGEVRFACIHRMAPIVRCWMCGRTSSRARATSPGKSISIHGEPVTSAMSNVRPPSSSRSRTASSCGMFARPPST